MKAYGVKCLKKKKYLQRHSILDDSYNKHTGCSSTWNSVLYGAQLLRSGMCWRVRNGNLIKFWNDNWTGLGALSAFALNPDAIDTDILVKDFWSNDDWNFQLLLTCLPVQIVNQISKIHLSQSDDVSDKQIWQPTSNGSFSVRSAYNVAIACDNDSIMAWKGIWSFNIPPKLKIFAQTVAHGRLLTNMQRYSRHLCTTPFCKFYPGFDESMLHLLRDCIFAQKLWNAIRVPSMKANFFQMDWNEWICSNIMQHGCSWKGFSWCECFIFICWYISGEIRVFLTLILSILETLCL